MVQTAINVYSIRDLDASVEEVIDRVSNAGYDGIQFSGRHTPLNADPTTIREKLAETGLETTGAHISVDDIENRIKKALSAYEPLDVNDAVIPHLPAEDFESAAAVEETAARLSSLSRTLDEIDWRLHYHNHEHEFIELADGLTGFEALIERTDIGIELDVGWAHYAGRSPIDLIETHGDRMPLIHMKDVDESAPRNECFREIGEGDVDMNGCAVAAREAGAEWLIYEYDTPTDPARSIKVGAEYLNSI
ncbi:sugar phosphate isomerase/epimerase family protein [Haladaptatus pallidirubidus]|uniref:Sugar phosphate isomerase/epimerase n=1 Tax=Haladaptatus pallidirubidus TaxID=1008152 RepID=A0AAV3UPM2_9EURY|nr:sugar phosphate isomerase/epimerase [Haladaptatus pallidirubidus]